MFFGSFEGVVRVGVAAVLAYLALILFLRASGKRSLAKLNAFDFVITVALGSTLATIIVTNNVPLVEGAFALFALLVLQFLLTWMSVRQHWLKRAVRSEPALLLSNGMFLDEALRRERVTRGEAYAALRKRGIGRVEDVAALVLETDGSFSAITRQGDALTTLVDVTGDVTGAVT